jgi:hypothetical protein
MAVAPDPIDVSIKHRAVCKVLGLDPAKTSDIQIHTERGSETLIRVEWSGFKHITWNTLREVLEASGYEVKGDEHDHTVASRGDGS